MIGNHLDYVGVILSSRNLERPYLFFNKAILKVNRRAQKNLNSVCPLDKHLSHFPCLGPLRAVLVNDFLGG